MRASLIAYMLLPPSPPPWCALGQFFSTATKPLLFLFLLFSLLPANLDLTTKLVKMFLIPSFCSGTNKEMTHCSSFPTFANSYTADF